MSLSTLLEAAKYLDYLDSSTNQEQNQNQQQHQQQQQQQQHLIYQQQQQQQAAAAAAPQAKASKKPTTRRQRFTKKSAANTMLAMSLPASTGVMQMHSVPIPLTSPGASHQATSLSSSFTTGSPLSSFASTALFCSKASGVTSASSSAASSLSSSDSSSSCGEILMGDADFNHSPSAKAASNNNNNNQLLANNNNNNNHHNYHLTTTQQLEAEAQIRNQFITNASANNNNNNNQSVARYIAATSTGPQLVTMTTSSGPLASTSAPVDGNIRAGHVIHAANAALINAASPGTSFDPRHHTSFSLATSPPGATSMQHHPFGANNNNNHHHHLQEGQTYNIAKGGFASDNHPGNSPTNPNCPPLIMARVQPMILNSISPSAHHSIMAFQPATASSPTSSTSSYSRHRELHKTLEKNRRAHLRHCFELLKSELPPSECVDKKTSHINIIKSAIRYVLILRQQEVEFENELHRLTKIKSELTENLSKLNINQSIKLETPSSSSAAASTSKAEIEQQPQQQPASEQQLSFLLSQSKLD